MQGVLPLPASAETTTTVSGIKITKLKTAPESELQAAAGDLAAIRFKGSYKDYVFDDIFETPEPLYFRCGGGNLVKGIDEVVSMMRVGDKWECVLPANMAFGNQGRPPSPGKPRIPAGADITYVIELVSLPGKDPELIYLED